MFFIHLNLSINTYLKTFLKDVKSHLSRTINYMNPQKSLNYYAEMAITEHMNNDSNRSSLYRRFQTPENELPPIQGPSGSVLQALSCNSPSRITNVQKETRGTMK